MLEHADLDLARRAPDFGAWMAHPDVAAQLDEGARLHGVDHKYLVHAAEIVHATLTKPLAHADRVALPPLVAATALAREVEFLFPLPARSPERRPPGS